jgi:hypothetical protein
VDRASGTHTGLDVTSSPQLGWRFARENRHLPARRHQRHCVSAGGGVVSTAMSDPDVEQPACSGAIVNDPDHREPVPTYAEGGASERDWRGRQNRAAGAPPTRARGHTHERTETACEIREPDPHVGPVPGCQAVQHDRRGRAGQPEAHDAPGAQRPDWPRPRQDRGMAEAVAMSENPGEDRIARLIAELDELPLDEREAAIAALGDEDREAVREAELEATEEAMPLDDEELGGEG